MKPKFGFALLVLLGWLLTFSALAQKADWSDSFDNKHSPQIEPAPKTVSVTLDAGWVNHFDGPPNNYLIKRGSQTIPVEFLTVLQVGDEIWVNNKQHTIQLSLRGGTQSVWVTSQKSPFVIVQNSRVPAEKESLWTQIKQGFSDWHQITQSVRSSPDNTSTEQKKLAMPLLENVQGPARLVAGERSLHLQWSGGDLPYRVVIYQRRNKLLNKRNILDPFLNVDLLTFEARKPYSVMLFGAIGQFRGGFITTKPEDMPNYPVDLAQTHLPENLQRTLQATWLVMQENGLWNFEAYQQVAPLTSYPPAQLLKEALARGMNREDIRDRGIRG
jgi:hypothetical protein